MIMFGQAAQGSESEGFVLPIVMHGEVSRLVASMSLQFFISSLYPFLARGVRPAMMESISEEEGVLWISDLARGAVCS